jgi:hypothetical protein
MTSIGEDDPILFCTHLEVEEGEEFYEKPGWYFVPRGGEKASRAIRPYSQQL